MARRAKTGPSGEGNNRIALVTTPRRARRATSTSGGSCPLSP